MRRTVLCASPRCSQAERHRELRYNISRYLVNQINYSIPKVQNIAATPNVVSSYDSVGSVSMSKSVSGSTDRIKSITRMTPPRG